MGPSPWHLAKKGDAATDAANELHSWDVQKCVVTAGSVKFGQILSGLILIFIFILFSFYSGPRS